MTLNAINKMTTKFYSRFVVDPYLDYQSIDYSDVSKSDYSFLAVATKLAATSDNRFRVGALVVKSGRVFGGSANITKKSPSTPPNRFSTHAEIAALRIASQTQDSTLYVSRLSSADTPALAKPCAWCIQEILDSGVYRVVYTVSDKISKYFYTSTIAWN
jgi:tRNA(Arg) A34 adenosine deaminase TadA